MTNTTIAAEAVTIDRLPKLSLPDVHLAQVRHREFEHSPELRRARLVADAWCAAFVATKTSADPAITQATLNRLQNDPLPAMWGVSTWGGDHVWAPEEASAVAAISDRYKFFHWHLEFPQIFRAVDGADDDGPGWDGGFSCVLGNPPWERIKLQEQEFFAASDPEIADAPNAAARKRLIKTLPERNPALHDEFNVAKRRADGESQFLRLSGRYPLCGRGDINTYSVFAEHDRSIVGPTGRLGVIVPTGIATDATTQFFFKDLVERSSLVSLYDFENRRQLFEAVDSRVKFCLLTLAGREERVPSAEFAFFQMHPDDLAREDSRFELTPDELRLLNPNTGTCPVFRTRRDAEITLGIYRRHPVLINEDLPGEEGNPWGLSFMTMFHMSNDSHLFHTRDELESDGWHLDGNVFSKADDKMLPLYEGKMIHHFDHRWAGYDGGSTRDLTHDEHDDPTRTALPRYWVSKEEVDDRLEGRLEKQWLLGFRNVCRSTDDRTFIQGPLQRAAVGNSMPLLLSRGNNLGPLVAALQTIPLDFVVRGSAGGANLNFFIVEQLPVPTPQSMTKPAEWSTTSTIDQWLADRVIELSYTAHEMAPFASDLGDDGSPFRWDVDRRAQLRAELDAAFFHLYGLDRSDTEYVLGTFPIANRKDPELTPRILREYDAMQRAIDTGVPYESPLDPPPGDGPRHDIG